MLAGAATEPVRCEVLAIGTELLLGHVVDTNSAWIGEQLAAAGIDCLRQVKVGDNLPRIVAAIRSAVSSADAVICCGGLGPTQDDITREAIAEVLGVELVRDEALVGVIEDLFAARGRQMPSNNLRQAQVPRGASVIAQTDGTAPGLICPLGGKVVYALPGVPHEMRDMLERAVVPDLLARSGEHATIRSRTLRTWGLAESRVAELVAGRIEALEASSRGQRATIAFLASGAEGIKVRVTVKIAASAGNAAASGGSAGDPVAEAEERLDAEEAELRAILGPSVFGVDEATMESVVADLLVRRGSTLAVAESLTGGLVASRAVSVPGASNWFKGGVVSYGSDTKRRLLEVSEGPVVSRRAAEEMASRVAGLFGADVGLATTGVAGPAEQEGQPVGTLWVGLYVDRGVYAYSVQQSGDRRRIRERSAVTALDLLRRNLAGLPVAP